MQKTNLNILVDKRGLMIVCIDHTIKAFSELNAKIKEMENEFPEQLMTISLTSFNTQVGHQYYMKNVERVYTMNNENYMPYESNAMLAVSIQNYFE